MRRARPPARSEPAAVPAESRPRVELIRPRWWLAGGCLAGVIVVTIVWSLVATLPQTVSANGTVVSPGQALIITSPAQGEVESLPDCAPDCVVAAGEQIFVINEFDTGKKVGVKAPAAGKLGPINVLAGSPIQVGDPLTTLELSTPDTSSEYLAHTYGLIDVDQDVAQEFPLGAKAYVLPQSANPQVNGVMTGVVSSVSQIVQSGAREDEALQKPTFHILIDLGAQPTWTGTPPSNPVGSGERATIGRVTGEPHPAQLIRGQS